MAKDMENPGIELPKKISWGKIIVGAAVVTAVAAAAVFGMGGEGAISAAENAFGATGKTVAEFIGTHVADIGKAVSQFAADHAVGIVGAAAGTAVVGSFTKQLLEKRRAEQELIKQFTR